MVEKRGRHKPVCWSAVALVGRKSILPRRENCFPLSWTLVEQEGDDKDGNDEDEEMIGFWIGAVKTRGDVKLKANLLAIETEGKKEQYGYSVVWFLVRVCIVDFG
jgi:hypothetical protein